MKALIPELNKRPGASLYEQLYEYIKGEIEAARIKSGERLPSLRELADSARISVTTCQSAYDQLLIEGYIAARPGSGYYVTGSPAAERPDRTGSAKGPAAEEGAIGGTGAQAGGYADSVTPAGVRPAPGNTDSTGAATTYATAGEPAEKHVADPETFDFTKWKKCFSYVMNYEQEELLAPADPQGEHALRRSISKYLYLARGVEAAPERIVVAAGVQQLTAHLSRILDMLGINIISTEDPGYDRVKRIFSDRGLSVNDVPVNSDGIAIERLPVNLRSAVYVSPSNQFPTGTVMPASRRRALLEWAAANSSIVIEDDYDSELRYFGKPVPALKGMDTEDLVVYLGSFSSTLFPAIKISYMVLPGEMAKVFDAIKRSYDQTCSKTEQLTLSEFMDKGYYRQGIRKLRKLCAKKLEMLAGAFEKAGASALITPEKTDSGMQIRLRVETPLEAEELCSRAASLGLRAVPAGPSPAKGEKLVALYFDQIPMGEIDDIVRKLMDVWNR